MSDLSRRLAEAQGLEAELKSQNDSAVAGAESARKKQASIVKMMSSMREGIADDAAFLHSETKKVKLDGRVELGGDSMLVRALAGGRQYPGLNGGPPPPPPRLPQALSTV